MVSLEGAINQSQHGGKFGVFACITCCLWLEKRQVYVAGWADSFSFSLALKEWFWSHTQGSMCVHVKKPGPQREQCWREADPRNLASPSLSVTRFWLKLLKALSGFCSVPPIINESSGLWYSLYFILLLRGFCVCVLKLLLLLLILVLVFYTQQPLTWYSHKANSLSPYKGVLQSSLTDIQRILLELGLDRKWLCLILLLCEYWTKNI